MKKGGLATGPPCGISPGRSCDLIDSPAMLGQQPMIRARVPMSSTQLLRNGAPVLPDG